MKILLITTLIFITQEIYSQTRELDDKNYGYHYVAGVSFGGLVGVMHKEPKNAFISSLVTSTGLGLLKEIHDTSHGKMFSNKDFGYTILGGLTSGIFIYLIKKNKKRKLSKL